MGDNKWYLTRKKKVRFRGWTEIVEGDTSTASGLVEYESWQDTNSLYRPGASETAGASYQQWLRWYLGDKDCLLCEMSCQFWCGVCVERGWTTLVDEVSL